MITFKLSEMPVGVGIEDQTHGYYTKELDGVGNAAWWPAVYQCCRECAEDDNVPNDKADEFFKDFKIISVPWAVAWELALKLQDEYGTVDCEGEDITVEGLIKDVLDETLDDQQHEWEKAQDEKTASYGTDGMVIKLSGYYGEFKLSDNAWVRTDNPDISFSREYMDNVYEERPEYIIILVTPKGLADDA